METKFRALAPILKGPKKGKLVWFNDVMTNGSEVITDFKICSDKYLKEVKAVCQFTGLKDCNKTKIYKGDIVKVENWRFGVYEIAYDDNLCRYGIVSESFKSISNHLTQDCFEVIGNIHEQESHT